MELLGSNPNEMFTYENLQSELKEYGNFALVMASMLIQISQADSNEIVNLDEISDKMAGGECRQELITDLKEQSKIIYAQRLSDVIEDIIRLDYYKKNFLN